MLETVEGPFGLQFYKIPKNKVNIGTNRGGWIYASDRPRHEVQLPEFLIMKTPLKTISAAKLLGDSFPDKSEYLDCIDLDIIKALSQLIGEHFDQEVRPPTIAEWEIAEKKVGLILPCGFTEILADEPSANHRGAQMDGRPRINKQNGVLKGQRVAYTCHPKKSHLRMRCTSPADRPLKDVGVRFVVSPKRKKKPIEVPLDGNLYQNIRSELLWITLIGIIPSFMIPVIRGFGDYALDGWANLLFGGLCIGFISGAFWRPKRPTFALNDVNEVIQI